MPVHLYGNVCDMDKINAFAKKYNLLVIEDNAEAFGGSYKGKKQEHWQTLQAAVFAKTRHSLLVVKEE
jgi:dTDP-4-amino-4,6-dideoxygalactose transaminase